MRASFFITLALTFMAAKLLAGDSNGHAWAMSASGNVLGKNYGTDIRLSDVANTPTWSMQTENPPVPVQKAVRLAEKHWGETLGSLKGWSREDLTLHELPNSNWIYEIQFKGPAYKSPKFGNLMESSVTVFVLMDGRVIFPKPRKEK